MSLPPHTTEMRHLHAETSTACSIQKFEYQVSCLQGTRDYNIGQGPEASVQQAAASLGVSLPAVQARQFQPEKDIVIFDLVMVMDKYTAADVLKEVRLDAIANSYLLAMKR